MVKIKEMGEGIVIEDAPVHRTTIDGVMAKGKRSTTNGTRCSFLRKLNQAVGCGLEMKIYSQTFAQQLLFISSQPIGIIHNIRKTQKQQSSPCVCCGTPTRSSSLCLLADRKATSCCIRTYK